MYARWSAPDLFSPSPAELTLQTLLHPYGLCKWELFHGTNLYAVSGLDKFGVDWKITELMLWVYIFEKKNPKNAVYISNWFTIDSHWLNCSYWDAVLCAFDLKRCYSYTVTHKFGSILQQNAFDSGCLLLLPPRFKVRWYICCLN